MKNSVKLKVEFISKNFVAHESVLINGTDSNDSIFKVVLLVTTLKTEPETVKATSYLC